MAILCQKLILGARSIICIKLDVPHCLLLTVVKMHFFVGLNAISSPHVPIMLGLQITRTVPVIKDVPDNAKVVFFGHIVFYFLQLVQTQLIPIAFFKVRQLCNQN